MPTTLTLKNIPDVLYARLKQAAGAHRRSMNSEVIVCLEAVLQPSVVTVDERLARARALREEVAGVRFQPTAIDAFKRAHRP